MGRGIDDIVEVLVEREVLFRYSKGQMRGIDASEAIERMPDKSKVG